MAVSLCVVDTPLAFCYSLGGGMICYTSNRLMTTSHTRLSEFDCDFFEHYAQAEDARDRRGQDVNLDHNTHSSQVTALGDSVLSVPAIHTKSVQPIGSHMFSPSTSRTPSPPRARADLRGSSSPTSSPQRMNSLRQQHSCITTSVQGVPSSENLVGMDDFVPPQASHRQYPQATDELMDVEDF